MLPLDTSALVKRYVEERGTDVVLARMAGDADGCASAPCYAEARVTPCHVGFDGAAEIGCDQRVRAVDAIHLASAERVAAASSFLTFDSRQASAARAIGLDVVETAGA